MTFIAKINFERVLRILVKHITIEETHQMSGFDEHLTFRVCGRLE